jgi:hypothetical protein
MDNPIQKPVSNVTPDAVSDNGLALKIIQLAGGDPVFAARIREMMWREYCDADCPFGSSEKGMMIWWSHAQETTLQ